MNIIGKNNIQIKNSISMVIKIIFLELEKLFVRKPAIKIIICLLIIIIMILLSIIIYVCMLSFFKIKLIQVDSKITEQIRNKNLKKVNCKFRVI